MSAHASRRLLAVCALLLLGAKQVTHPAHACNLPRSATSAGTDPVGGNALKRRGSDKPLRLDPLVAKRHNPAYEACIDHPSPDGVFIDCQALLPHASSAPGRRSH